MKLVSGYLGGFIVQCTWQFMQTDLDRSSLSAMRPVRRWLGELSGLSFVFRVMDCTRIEPNVDFDFPCDRPRRQLLGIAMAFSIRWCIGGSV